MPVSFRWTVGPAGAEAPLRPASPEIPPRTGSSTARRLVVATLYLGALAAAGLSGVMLGQRQFALAHNVEGISNQVAVEQLAWSEGDTALYASTLGPDLPAAQRERLLASFRSSAPRNLELSVLDVAFVASDRAEVTVEPRAHGAAVSTAIERRQYRRVGASWLRSR